MPAGIRGGPWMESEDRGCPGIRRVALRRPGLREAALGSCPRGNLGRLHRTRPHTDHHALPEVAVTTLAFVAPEYRPRAIRGMSFLTENVRLALARSRRQEDAIPLCRLAPLLLCPVVPQPFC